MANLNFFIQHRSFARLVNGSIITQRLSSIASVGKDKNERITLLGKSYLTDEFTNITPNILSKLDKQLHNLANHPLNILKEKIHMYLYATHRTRWGSPVFTMIDNFSPIVSTDQNFNSLLVPEEHVARSRNDNYYINKDTLLRGHTTAHGKDLIMMGLDAWVLTGDVYRRDEIDRTHYPVFHQMDGVKMFVKHELFQNYQGAMEIFSYDPEQTLEKQAVHNLEAVKLVEYNLKETLSSLVQYLCCQNVEIRWVDAYFPFTHPSWEMEIKVENDWIELLGCGILQHNILINAGAGNKIAWAFGIGLERLAMKLFGIPDIRLFWSKDERFISQFHENKIVQFKPFSKYPPSYKDVSFWISGKYTANNFYEIVRSTAGDIVEKVELIDEFMQPGTSRVSHCYRITYRSMEKTFRDEEVNEIQDLLREQLRLQLEVELRG